MTIEQIDEMVLEIEEEEIARDSMESDAIDRELDAMRETAGYRAVVGTVGVYDEEDLDY